MWEATIILKTFVNENVLLKVQFTNGDISFTKDFIKTPDNDTTVEQFIVDTIAVAKESKTYFDTVTLNEKRSETGEKVAVVSEK